MNQSTVIFGFLATAFVVFITVRGELPIYWGFLAKSPQGPATGITGTTGQTVTPTQSTANAAGQAAKAIDFTQAATVFLGAL